MFGVSRNVGRELEGDGEPDITRVEYDSFMMIVCEEESAKEVVAVVVDVWSRVFEIGKRFTFAVVPSILTFTLRR